MSEPESSTSNTPIAEPSGRGAQPGRGGGGADEVHRGDDGYGKAPQSSAGFSGKPVASADEEHAEALLELFERCRRVVKKES